MYLPNTYWGFNIFMLLATSNTVLPCSYAVLDAVLSWASQICRQYLFWRRPLLDTCIANISRIWGLSFSLLMLSFDDDKFFILRWFQLIDFLNFQLAFSCHTSEMFLFWGNEDVSCVNLWEAFLVDSLDNIVDGII